jgi:hypothetical protein
MVEGNSVMGEICHIRAVSPNGPRHDPEQSTVGRHAYDNLILLCAKHHKVVDDDPEAYTVQRLIKMKVDHATRVAALPADEVEHGARLLIDQSVASADQSDLGTSMKSIRGTLNNVRSRSSWSIYAYLISPLMDLRRRF